MSPIVKLYSYCIKKGPDVFLWLLSKRKAGKSYTVATWLIWFVWDFCKSRLHVYHTCISTKGMLLFTSKFRQLYHLWLLCNMLIEIHDNKFPLWSKGWHDSGGLITFLKVSFESFIDRLAWIVIVFLLIMTKFQRLKSYQVLYTCR